MSYYNSSNVTTVEKLAILLLAKVRRNTGSERRRSADVTSSLTKEDLIEILNNQNVSCAKTYYPFLPFSDKKLFRPSVDRICNSKPYQKDNVQILLTGINFAKNDASDSDLNELLEIIKQA
jgi:hypothetical protein